MRGTVFFFSPGKRIYLSYNLSVHVLHRVIYQALLMTVYRIHISEHKNAKNSDKSIFFLSVWNNCTVLHTLGSLHRRNRSFDRVASHVCGGKFCLWLWPKYWKSAHKNAGQKLPFSKCLRCRYTMINVPDSSGHAKEKCDMSPRGICLKIWSVRRVNGEVISSFSLHYSPAALYT